MEKPKKKLLVDASDNFKYRKMILDFQKMKKDFEAEHEAMHKKYDDLRAQAWLNMETSLKEEGLLDKSYSKKSPESLSYDEDSFCIFLNNEGHDFDDLPPFIKKIIKIDLDRMK